MDVRGEPRGGLPRLRLRGAVRHGQDPLRGGWRPAHVGGGGDRSHRAIARMAFSRIDGERAAASERDTVAGRQGADHRRYERRGLQRHRQSCVRRGDLGSGDRALDDACQPVSRTLLSLGRTAPARRACHERGRQRPSRGRGILAALSLRRRKADDQQRARRRRLRPGVLGADTRRLEHHRRHMDQAAVGHPRLRSEPAHQPPGFHAGKRRAERDRTE